GQYFFDSCGNQFILVVYQPKGIERRHLIDVGGPGIFLFGYWEHLDIRKAKRNWAKLIHGLTFLNLRVEFDTSCSANCFFGEPVREALDHADLTDGAGAEKLHPKGYGTLYVSSGVRWITDFWLEGDL